MGTIENLAADLSTSLGAPLALLAGVALLFFGRRLYWFLAGVVGFGVVFLLAPRFLPEHSDQATLLISALAGVVGAVVAVLAQRVLLGLVGGLGGALLGLSLAQELGFDTGLPWILVAIAGGLLGAVLVRKVFEFSLILLSSLLGARILAEAFPSGGRFLLVWAGIAAVGVCFQLFGARRRRRRARRDD